MLKIPQQKCCSFKIKKIDYLSALENYQKKTEERYEEEINKMIKKLIKPSIFNLFGLLGPKDENSLYNYLKKKTNNCHFLKLSLFDVDLIEMKLRFLEPDYDRINQMKKALEEDENEEYIYLTAADAEFVKENK